MSARLLLRTTEPQPGLFRRWRTNRYTSLLDQLNLGPPWGIRSRSHNRRQLKLPNLADEHRCPRANARFGPGSKPALAVVVGRALQLPLAQALTPLLTLGAQFDWLPGFLRRFRRVYCLIARFKSLLSKGNHGIDARRAPRGNCRGGEGYHQQQRRYCGKRRRVAHAPRKQEACHHTG